MNIYEVVDRIDFEMLKEQGRTVEGMIDWLQSEMDLGGDQDYIDRLRIDQGNLEGLLELIDNLVTALEDS